MPPTTRRSSRASQSDSTTPIQSSLTQLPLFKALLPNNVKEELNTIFLLKKRLHSLSMENLFLLLKNKNLTVNNKYENQNRSNKHNRNLQIFDRPKICPGSKSIYLEYIDPNKIQGQSGTYIYRPRPLLEDAPNVSQFQSRDDFDRAFSKWKARRDLVKNSFRNVNAPKHRVKMCPVLFMAVPDKNKTIRIFGDLENFAELLKPDTVVSIWDGDFSLKHDLSKTSYGRNHLGVD
ncbi:hypothetical protein RCL1_008288 [Eukaryota sp. TZLM3-RCL]